MTRGWGLMLACGLLGSGCYRTTVSVQEQRVLLREERSVVGEETRSVAPIWHFRDGVVVGQLQPTLCDTTRVWQTTRERVTEKRPRREWGIGLLGLGLASGIAGAATYDSNLYLTCNDNPDFNGISQPRSCSYREADNSLAKGFLTAALLAELVGAGQLLFTRPDVRVETLSRVEQATQQREPCSSRRDMSELLLVLRGPAGQLWPVQVSPAGAITVPLQTSRALPRGVDLKLVVYRAPHSKSSSFERGQVLDTLQLPSDDEKDGAE